ncbi:Phosphatidylinositol glycan, partial [Fasciolopsis buskii]
LCTHTLEIFVKISSLCILTEARHTSNWAVLVDTSRFWFNYRHLSNVLALYRHIKRLGIPDSRIILMVSDDASCNARNPRPANIYNHPYDRINLYGESIEIDYRGNEATVENFIRLLTGRLPPSTPSSKRLNTDEHSNILIYMTGHGGDGFLKFQDDSELSNSELADAIEQMWQKKRYHEILFIAETCQAESMGLLVYSPNVITIGSSAVGEDSLSLHVDNDIGVFMSDRYSYYAAEFLKTVEPNSSKTMDQFLTVCPWPQCHSTVKYRTDLLRRPIEAVPVTDFFGSVRRVEAGPLDIELVTAHTIGEQTSQSFQR